MVLRSTAFVGGLIVLAAASLPAQRPSERLDWLAGCWELQGRNAVITHEMWLPPAGGLLLGASRAVRSDSVISYGAMRIQEHGVLDPNGTDPRGYQRLYRHGQDGTWKIAVDRRP